MTNSVSVSRSIPAAPAAVWELVSDLPRMGDWSPENTGGKWVKGATGPAVGARFKGTNANGSRSWTTDSTITVCEPGRAVEWKVTAAGMPIAVWGYHVEPNEEGCLVTETWTDRRGWLTKILSRSISKVDDRASYNRSGMERTLENLGAAACPAS